jgi:hypothetical protein
MKCEPADSAGHDCQRKSWLDTVLPSPMSLPAMRTSTVSICAIGAGAGGGASDRPASSAAMPPAAMAMIRTMMRAGFMTLHFPQITLRPGRCARVTDCPDPYTVVVHARFDQLNVKAWLMVGI